MVFLDPVNKPQQKDTVWTAPACCGFLQEGFHRQFSNYRRGRMQSLELVRTTEPISRSNSHSRIGIVAPNYIVVVLEAQHP